LNFAFALIDPDSFAVAPMSSGDPELMQRLTALKEINPGLEVWLSIGGWSMNDADQPTAGTFSQLAGSTSAQSAFFTSLIQIMQNYGFDGVDIDWEYPVAPERSGNPQDFANYPTFLTNLKGALGKFPVSVKRSNNWLQTNCVILIAASGHNYGLTITLPSLYWYLQNFDIVKIEPIVDWFNVMTYDVSFVNFVLHSISTICLNFS
jgi:chitinase